MIRGAHIGLALAAAASATPASARDFLYPWKPGVTKQQVSDDQTQCMQLAKGHEAQIDTAERARRAGRPAPPPPEGSKAAIAPGLDSLTGFFNSYYDCLRERGYSIRRMPGRDYRALKKAGGMAVIEAMIAPVSPHAEVPRGTIK